jgi:hypothetical protein
MYVCMSCIHVCIYVCMYVLTCTYDNIWSREVYIRVTSAHEAYDEMSMQVAIL